MKPEIPTPSPKLPRPVWQQVRWPLLTLAVVLLLWLLVVNRETPAPREIPQPPQIGGPSQDARGEFFSRNIEPYLLAHERANRAAADRAILRIDDLFLAYKRGVQPFSEDITSMGTRFGILRRMPADWWYEEERVRDYVQGKFEQHLFSEVRLNDDLRAVLTAFAEDIEANRNRMLAQVRSSLLLPDAPDFHVPDMTAYERQVEELLLELAEGRARDSVYHEIATMGASEAAAILARQIVLRVFTASATSAATSAAASGGATSTGAAAGGTAGALGGPVGIAISVGVGLVIGGVVDSWMRDRFRTRLEKDLTEYIDSLRNLLLEGDGETEGFRRTIYHFTDDLNGVQTSLLHQSLLET